jgi:hypothetical protein
VPIHPIKLAQPPCTKPGHWPGCFICYCNASAVRALTRVPRFYFDAVLQGRTETDREGVELADRAVARQEAIRAAAEMAKDQHLDGDARDITVAIREGDKPIATIRLSLKIEESA